jgi:hypothetical protein
MAVSFASASPSRDVATSHDVGSGEAPRLKVPSGENDLEKAGDPAPASSSLQ